MLSAIFTIVKCEKDENKQKESGIGPFLKKNYNYTLDEIFPRNLTYKVVLE